MARLTEPTRFCARILGPFLALAGGAAVLRRDELPSLVQGFREAPALTFSVGVLIMLAGLALLAHHQKWRRPAEAAVSLIAWLLTLRGVLLILVPGVVFDLAERLMRSTALALGAGLAAVALGVWLTLVGYRRAPV